MVVAREIRGDDLLESYSAILSDVSCQTAGCGVVIVTAARRIGSMVINLCQLDGLRVDPGRVPAAMLDEYRMAGKGSV